MSPDIWIVGLGIASIDHVTRETERAIRRSNEVLFADTGLGTRPFLESLCPRVTDLFHDAYPSDGPRISAYHHMAARVIEAALDHAPITFAMHGHPLVFSYPPLLVSDLAETLGLEVAILPGISATASLICELGIDPGTRGIQMMEATDLLVRRRPIQADMDALIWQVGIVGTRLYTSRPSRPERLDPLVTYLLQFYPETHEVTAVYAPPHALVKTARITCTLAALRDYAAELHAGYTLYVPALGERPILDTGALGRADDPSYLRRVTEP